MFRSIGLPELLIVVVVLVALVLLPFWKIFSKAGYPGALSLLICVPMLGYVMIWFLAFSDWPILRKLRTLETPPT